MKRMTNCRVFTEHIDRSNISNLQIIWNYIGRIVQRNKDQITTCHGVEFEKICYIMIKYPDFFSEFVTCVGITMTAI